MDITIPKAALSRIAKRLQTISDAKSGLVAFSHTLLSAESGQLFACAGNRFARLETFVPATVAKEGGVMVPTKSLLSALKALAGQEVRLRVNGSFMLTLDELDADRQLKVQGCQPADLQPLQWTGPSIELKTSDVATLIGCTEHAISTDETRAHIAHALFARDDSGLRMVATDGCRLAMHSLPAISEAPWFSLHINTRGLSELKRTCVEQSPALLDMCIQPHQVAFTLPETALVIERTCSVFPPYWSVIPKSSYHNARVSKKALLAAIKAVVNMRQKADALDLQLSDGRLCVSGSCGNSRIETVATGISPSIRLCAKFVYEAVSAAPQDAIELEFNGETDPMVIRASSYLALVMPMGR